MCKQLFKSVLTACALLMPYCALSSEQPSIVSVATTSGIVVSSTTESSKPASNKSSSSVGDSKVVYAEDFEQMSVGSTWRGNSDLRVVDDEKSKSKAVRVTYNLRRKETAVGSNAHQFAVSIPPAREYTLQYDVLYETGWSDMGGKMHGLVPERWITGCKTIKSDGWSSRMVFADGYFQLYLYDQNKDSRCGRKIQGKTKLELEEWYSISLYVKTNSDGKTADGEAEVYVNGIFQVRFENALFYESGGQDVLINNFFFSTFTGSPSNTEGGAVYHTQYARFDNFAVVPGKVVRK